MRSRSSESAIMDIERPCATAVLRAERDARDISLTGLVNDVGRHRRGRGAGPVDDRLGARSVLYGLGATVGLATMGCGVIAIVPLTQPDPLIRTFTGHLGPISSVALSPDGRTALSASRDNSLKLWEVATGKELHTLTGHSHVVRSVAFSPDGRTALSGSLDKTLKVWDVATGKELRTFTGHLKGVDSVAF